ncbi:MAG: universal stress protein [Alphaproteobacteria bacterium]|nr:MAG: universal stress protein [Alphaproteobacteria bacterium]
MALKNILVGIDPSTDGESRLKLALNLVRAHQAHVTVCYVMREEHDAPVSPIFAGMPVNRGDTAAGDPVFPPASREAERAGQIEELFRTELRAHGLGGEWQLLSPGETAVFIDLAKVFDLTILGQLSPEIRSTGFRPDEIVIATGRPVLVVPYAGTFDTVGRRVLVAWDGTREAARAANDALPLLENAEAVTVMFVGARETTLAEHHPSIERMVQHLQRHGIPAQAEETLQGDLRISDVLLSRAADLAVDLLVAGGYHHSQLREALVGGVSRELLDHITVPVLMSH